MNYNSNFLIILVGLPASGKSTLAFKLKEKFELHFQKNVRIIDPDKIRLNSFSESFDFRNEPRVRKKNMKLVKKHLSKGEIVISDDLNYYSSMRHDLKLIADSLDINFYIIHSSTPLKLCLRRNEERGKPIPNEVIENIYNKFDNFNRYKWDTPFETYDITEEQNINQFLENLCVKIESNLQEKEKYTEKMQKKLFISNREERDLISRRVVSELLKNPKYRKLKKTLLEYRKVFINSRIEGKFDFDTILEDFKGYLDEKL